MLPDNRHAMLSIIIPTLNEAPLLTAQLQRLQALFSSAHCSVKAEVIVVDGGSSDSSLAIGQTYANLTLTSARSRALQMNLGAERASGDILLFLHADTQLPADSSLLIEAFAHSAYQWGFFPVRLDHMAWYFRVIEWFMNKRSRCTRIATGDQALCVRREVFVAHKGFAEIPLMEDVELSARLRKASKPWLASSPVRCNVRQWQKHGVVRLTLIMWYLRLAYYFGASPSRLADIYYGRQSIDGENKR